MAGFQTSTEAQRGNVVVAGALDASGGSALVAEFGNRREIVRWRKEIPNDTGARYNVILDVELAPDGDLVVAGPLGGFPVRRLSPVGDELMERACSGGRLWRGSGSR